MINAKDTRTIIVALAYDFFNINGVKPFIMAFLIGCLAGAKIGKLLTDRIDRQSCLKYATKLGLK